MHGTDVRACPAQLDACGLGRRKHPERAFPYPPVTRETRTAKMRRHDCWMVFSHA